MKKRVTNNSILPITSPDQAAGILRENLHNLDHEESWILLLSSDKRPLTKKVITIGTLSTTLIDHRRIVKEALLSNASAIILFHNHPSGSAVPSAADIRETNRLRKACAIFDISLLDHIILTDDSYYSFSDETQNRF